MRQHEHVYEALLEPFTAVYGQPNKPEYLEAFYREYAHILQKYSRAELFGAKDRLLHKFPPGKFQRWPSIPDIVAACEDEKASTWVRVGVAAERVVANSYTEKLRREKEDRDAWSPEAFIIADQLVQSSLGRLAASQGWILGLHDYCRRHRQLPDPVKDSKTIAAMKASALYVDDCLAGKVDMGLCAAALRNMARNMRAKRGKLRDLVLREDRPC